LEVFFPLIVVIIFIFLSFLTKSWYFYLFISNFII